MTTRRVIFLRHGESYDDIYKEFGGWSNRRPTKAGYSLAKTRAKEIKQQYPDLLRVYCSPLRRASGFAKMFAQELSLPLETNVYLKERNTYGLLNGLKYTTAQEKYPELMKLFDAQQFIPGSERYDDFIDRVTLLLEWIKQTADVGTTVYVTQGYLMTTILEEFFGESARTYYLWFLFRLRNRGQ